MPSSVSGLNARRAHIASLSHPTSLLFTTRAVKANFATSSWSSWRGKLRSESLPRRLKASSARMDLDRARQLGQRGSGRTRSRPLEGHRPLRHQAGQCHSITGEGAAKLADFGIARAAKSNAGVTRTGAFMGTLSYASPEQLDGRPATAASDLYSLGCVLYECLVGHRPFEADIDVAVVAQHLQKAPEPLRPSALRYPNS